MADASDLQRIYEARFAADVVYRRQIWAHLVGDFFQRYVRSGDTVLDLGCGYGEFINAVQCLKKFGMDLNPDAPRHLQSGVHFLAQDCATRWLLDDGTVDVVFTSNFFEHLPDKTSLGRTLDEILRCLAPGGRLIAMGPNIRYLPGAYWDFWDHFLPLSEKSLAEGLSTRGFEIERSVGKFLPYTMAHGPRYPVAFLRAYLKLPFAWRLLGKQFLVVAKKPAA